MAHCAPRQLGTALPSVVPKLSEVLSDPHPKVQLAARQALKEVGTGISVVLISISVAIDLESLIEDKQAYQEHASPWFVYSLSTLGCPCAGYHMIWGSEPLYAEHYAQSTARDSWGLLAWMQVGSVIRNAEVQALAPVLLAAIAEPNTKAKAALETLLNTIFVNTVDAASLALIVPVVHRGLRDRSGDAKKKAARIVGDMCELINEPKVHLPALPPLSEAHDSSPLCIIISIRPTLPSCSYPPPHFPRHSGLH